MISSEISNFINKIVEKTEDKSLNWQYADDIFRKAYNKLIDSKSILELAKYCMTDGNSLGVLDSFYLCNNNKYLFLLHIYHELERGKELGANESWKLFAIFDLNDDMYIHIPDYHPAYENDRLKKLSGLIEQNKNAEKEEKEKRLLEFFDSFL